MQPGAMLERGGRLPSVPEKPQDVRPEIERWERATNCWLAAVYDELRSGKDLSNLSEDRRREGIELLGLAALRASPPGR